MIRRKFLASVAALLATAVPVLGWDAPKYHRFDRAADKWKPIQKIDIKEGMVVWIENEFPGKDHSPWGVYFCASDAHFDGLATTFAVSHWMNKAGEWVSYATDYA